MGSRTARLGCGCLALLVLVVVGCGALAYVGGTLANSPEFVRTFQRQLVGIVQGQLKGGVVVVARRTPTANQPDALTIDGVVDADQIATLIEKSGTVTPEQLQAQSKFPAKQGATFASRDALISAVAPQGWKYCDIQNSSSSRPDQVTMIFTSERCPGQ